MIKKNLHSWIFFSIAIIALLCDFLYFFTKLNYEISLLISTIVITITNIVLLKTKKLKLTKDLNIFDICFFIFVICNIIVKIPIPDYTSDVRGYHIYLQEHFFTNKVNFDFFTGTFYMPLGDRINYIFRYFLGYRLGTIFSHYLYIVLYYQIKKTLSYFSNNKNIYSILAFISLFFIKQIHFLIGTYYIDVISTVFILEILNSLLFQEKKTSINNFEFTYICLLTGCACATRISNLLLIAPITLFFVIVKKIKIKIKQIPIIVLTIIPLIPYMIYNYIQTGNPIFPYYNSIFKSKYTGGGGYPSDPRFGIKNIFYFLIWPVYVSVIKLGYGDGIEFIEPVVAIGYIVTILSLLLMKDKKNKIYKFIVFTLLLTYLWEYLFYGYMRYALIIPILFSIVISLVYIKLFNFNFNKKKTNLIIITSISILLVFNCIIHINKDVRNNYKYILKDKTNNIIHINGVWGTIFYDTAATSLVREDNTPIYNLVNRKNEKNITKKMYFNRVKNNDIYVFIDSYEKIDELKKNGYELSEPIKVYTVKELPFLNYNDSLYLYKVKYIEK